MALAVTAVVTVGVLALSLLGYVGVQKRLYAAMDEDLTTEVESLSETVEAAAGDSEAAARQAVRDYLATRQARGTSRPVLAFESASGGVIANCGVRIEDVIEPAGDGLVGATGDEESGGCVTARIGDEAYRVACRVVERSDGDALGVLGAALPTAGVRETSSRTLQTFLGAGLAVVLLTALFSVAVARTSLAPLRRAAETAARVTRSSMDARVEHDGADDEVGVLVAALNDMLDRLEAAFGEQRQFVHDASIALVPPLEELREHLSDASDPETGQAAREESLAVARAQVDRLEHLLTDLLALAGLEGGPEKNPEVVDVRAITRQAVERSRTGAEDAVSLGHLAHCWVLGDSDGLRQAVLNVLRYCVARSPGPGTVRVSCTISGSDVSVVVDDEGPALEPEDLSRLFDRLFRPSGPDGTGLGLAIAKRVVELHGGSVCAENRRNVGVRFRLVLPGIESHGSKEAARAGGGS